MGLRGDTIHLAPRQKACRLTRLAANWIGWRPAALGRQLHDVILQRLAVSAALPPLVLGVSNPILHTTGRWGYVPGNQLLHKTDQFQGAAEAQFPTSECKKPIIFSSSRFLACGYVTRTGATCWHRWTRFWRWFHVIDQRTPSGFPNSVRLTPSARMHDPALRASLACGRHTKADRSLSSHLSRLHHLVRDCSSRLRCR